MATYQYFSFLFVTQSRHNQRQTVHPSRLGGYIIIGPEKRRKSTFITQPRSLKASRLYHDALSGSPTQRTHRERAEVSKTHFAFALAPCRPHSRYFSAY